MHIHRQKQLEGYDSARQSVDVLAKKRVRRFGLFGICEVRRDADVVQGIVTEFEPGTEIDLPSWQQVCVSLFRSRGRQQI
jgi:hypothetical protein